MNFIERLLARKILVPLATAVSVPNMERIESLGARRNPLIIEALEAERVEDPTGSQLDPAEWKRILELPVRRPATEEDIDAVSEKSVDARAFDGGFRLRVKQIDSLQEFYSAGGLLGQVAAGAGKTLISVMLADRGIRQGAKRAIILVPPQVYEQLMRTDLPFLRARIPVGCQFVGLGKATRARRQMIIDSAGKSNNVTYVLPYSLLSRVDTRALLDAINPGIVVADEAHYLKNRSSARTKRFLDFMKAHPDCKFAAMSGTLTSKSLADYHHLAVLALRDKAPVPKGATQGGIWASYLDANSIATAERAKDLQPLRSWAKRALNLDTPYTIDGFREAYRGRLESAPGCVLSRGIDDLETSLVIDAVDCELPPASPVHQYLRDLDTLWQAPTGDEISHAIHLYKWRYELTAGFYYALEWPTARDSEHQRLIDLAKEHHSYLQEYNRELRQYLSNTSVPNLDSPMLVGAAIARKDTKHLPSPLIGAWHSHKQREFEGMPHRVQRPVRLDDYKLRAAAAWAKDLAKNDKGERGGIIWVHHHEMLDWLCAEIPGAVPARAGDLELLKHSNKDLVFVASMSAHGTGKNMQHFRHQIFVQWPRPANTAEQVLARLHRPGQEADEMVARILFGIDFDHQLFCATLSDSLYIQLTTHADLRLLSCGYARPPKIYDPRLLDRLGFQGNLRKLDGEKLREKFGG